MPLKMKLARQNGQENSSIARIWIQAFRLQFVPTSILPAMLGSVIAWVMFREFQFLYFILVIIGVTFHHMALNVIDDVFDYLHAVDRSHGTAKNPYTGGSGVLTGKLLSVGQMMGAAISCYLLASIIGIYLTWAVGWHVLLFVGIGLFSSVFYSAPPVRYGYRGFGELSLLINFGPVICLGAFYIQTGTVAWEPFMVSLIPGFLMWSMIIINEIPDYDEDRQAGKLNIVARLGKKKSTLIYAAGLICAYGTILLAPSLRVTSLSVLPGLLSMPLAYSSIRILNANYSDKLKMIPANLAMIKIHALTMSGLIIGYLAEGIILKWP
jgi:1,4-dihydroxy-2-naphthoate polyprenyltransferase